MLNFPNIKIYLLFSFLLTLLVSCSNPQPENKWKHDAAGMCLNYQKHFLEAKDLRAALDLRHAKKSATRSAQLKTLIDIELTACAMELSVLNPSPCEDAAKLLELEPNKEQKAYYNLLSSQLKYEDIPQLPSQYRDFASSLLLGDIQAININISKIEPLSSRLVTAALAKEHIDDKNIDELIHRLSFKGYKKPLLSWMYIQMRKEEAPQEKARLMKKIKVLNSH